ncbi:hypothetical protein HRI_002381100 [Hibiscus trionum]|uniref:Uncharacterized protein n=1 Tax=Hibiscus trionum TaxID=183268 RepID=A0A9W7I148_HIBTR|nr:hypothetical protein HRI_002381100 [Hibiscus trionum]
MRRSGRGKEPEYELDPEIERTYHLRNQVRLLIKRNNYLEKRLEAMVNGRQGNVVDNFNNNNNPRVMLNLLMMPKTIGHLLLPQQHDRLAESTWITTMLNWKLCC